MIHLVLCGTLPPHVVLPVVIGSCVREISVVHPAWPNQYGWLPPFGHLFACVLRVVEMPSGVQVLGASVSVRSGVLLSPTMFLSPALPLGQLLYPSGRSSNIPKPPEHDESESKCQRLPPPAIHLSHNTVPHIRSQSQRILESFNLLLPHILRHSHRALESSNLLSPRVSLL